MMVGYEINEFLHEYKMENDGFRFSYKMPSQSSFVTRIPILEPYQGCKSKHSG